MNAPHSHRPAWTGDEYRCHCGAFTGTPYGPDVLLHPRYHPWEHGEPVLDSRPGLIRGLVFAVPAGAAVWAGIAWGIWRWLR